jgi:hypothetical protein
MTGPEHYAEAERLLALAGRHTRPFTLMASRFTKSAHLAGRQTPIPDLPGAQIAFRRDGGRSVLTGKP